MWFYPLWTIRFYSRLRCLLPFLLFRQVVLANTRHDEHDFIHYCRLGRYHSDCLTSKHLCQRDMGCRWSACLTRTSFFMSLIRQVMDSLSLGCVITWVVLSTCTYNSATSVALCSYLSELQQRCECLHVRYMWWIFLTIASQYRIFSPTFHYYPSVSTQFICDNHQQAWIDILCCSFLC